MEQNAPSGKKSRSKIGAPRDCLSWRIGKIKIPENPRTGKDLSPLDMA